MTTPRRRSVVAALVTAALLPLALTACSGEEDPAPVSPPSAVPPAPDPGPTDLVPADAAIARAFAAASPGRTLRLQEGLYSLQDFLDGGDSSFNGASLADAARGVVGAGPGVTVLEMAPRSSTRAALIPTTFPDTNQLSLLRVGPSARVVAGFTLRGTDQGHLYNGLRVSRTRDVDVRDVHVEAIPGDDSSPPGETFGINDYRTAGSRYVDVVVDGRGVGAAGFGANGSARVTLVRCTFEDDPYSHGATFYQVDGVDIRDSVLRRNGQVGLNLERVTGTVRITGTTFAGNAAADVRVASDRGSTHVVISDPHTDGRPVRVVLPPTYAGSPNLQRPDDIRVVVGGRDRTADLLRVVAG